eukprot:TRINITY_DN7510_c0_g1_i3.p1 TRINITY_DN7510_c0_g1~~TRINITY_DN7510_c0_g1_i3.p1  ORF type:complete len:140 (-),score=62.90 TRINITY_DN7510_c0_g1_i3:147-566(-)
MISSPFHLSLIKARMLDEFWRAVVTAYINQGCHLLDAAWFSPPSSLSSVPTWEEIRAKTLDLATNQTNEIDEHVYKLVFVYQQDMAEGFFNEEDEGEKGGEGEGDESREGKLEGKQKEMDEFLRLVSARKVGLLPWALT